MLLLFGLLAGAPPVINEIHYDPPGPDTGAEFVELFNPDGLAVPLAGYRLEFANGAGDGTWEVRWVGGAADTVAAQATFLIADTGWSGPPPGATVRLALQNGPDALRLARPDGTTDTVGWGDLDADALHEGTPAFDVSGQALARRPDGHDTDDNATDFQAAAPTPGAANWPDFAPRLAAWSWQPPVAAAAAAPLLLRLEITNAGRRDLAGCVLDVATGGVVVTGVLATVLPGSTRIRELTLAAPAAGRPAVLVELRSGAAADTVRWDLGRVQVGPAAVRLAEVMAAPAAGGEWLEIVNHDVVPRNLAEMSLRDEDGAWRSLPDLVLAPGDCRLLAQDPAVLAEWLADLSTAGVALPCEPAPPLAMPGWPSLNNSAPATRDFADRLYLAAADGTVIDFVTIGLGSGRAPAGRSLERGSDGRWRPATAPAGATAGCPPPAPLTVVAGEVRLDPNPFSRGVGDGAVHVHLVVPEAAVGYQLQVFDLWGRTVRDLGGDDLGPGPRQAIWDGRDEGGEPLPAGGYVVVVRWCAADGATGGAIRKLVVIREGGP